MQPDAHTLLFDAIEALETITEFIRDRSSRDYADDRLLRSAVARQLEIVGESLAQFRRRDPDSAARVGHLTEAVALRNVLAHGYAVVNRDIVWRTATDDAPALLANLRALLATEPEEPPAVS